MSTTQPELHKNKMSKPSSLTRQGIIPFLTFLALNFVCDLTPVFFGLEWIPGWPKLCMNSAAFAIAVLLGLLLGRKKEPRPKLEKKQIRKFLLLLPIVVSLLGVSLYLYSFVGYPKTVEYLHSPNRVNTAVVLRDKNDGKSLYRVRMRVFYERKTITGLHPEYTCRWIDDTTIEFADTNSSWKNHYEW